MNKNHKHIITSIVMIICIITAVLFWNCSQEDRKKPQQLSIDTNIVSNKKAEELLCEEPPQPVKGYKAIQENLIYPEKALKTRVEGRVMIWALVNKNGKIIKTKVKESIGSGCEEAAIKAIKSVQWEVPSYDIQDEGVWILIPIDFKLS